MNDNDIRKALDICAKLDFFGGQRAGRELWFQKPVEVQEADITQFVKDVAFLRRIIRSQMAENEELKAYNENLLSANVAMSCGLLDEIKMAKTEAIREFAWMLKAGIHEDIQSGCDCADYLTDDLPDIIDSLAKEMTEGGHG